MLVWWLGVAMLVAGAAAVCPQHCSCFTDPDGYESANCSVLALRQDTRSSIERLAFHPRLEGYPTELFPRAFLPFPKAKFLWMVNCSVLSLPWDVFHGLNYVIRLDLSYNKIRKLNGVVFKPMESLTTLRLRSNPLELTPWDLIASDSLQELDLGHCGLRSLPIGAFSGVPRLSRLYLDGNELRTLMYNTYPPTLRYINLARNRISDVPTEVFTSMSLLRKIDLSKNPINCTCNLLIMQDWFSGQGVIFDNGVTCSEPNQYKGMRLGKINENELCTLEEVRRQRRINDIQSYRDHKPHRTHNMIRDPDFQSDQPNHNYAEVLYPDDGRTHMEMSKKHFSILPTDLNDENNKVTQSKLEIHSTELDLSSSTSGGTVGDEEEESSVEQDVPFETTHAEDSFDATTSISNTTVNEDDKEKCCTSTSPIETNTNSTDVHSSIDLSENTIPDNRNLNKSIHDEFAEEGYSLVDRMSDIMMSDGEGSGDGEISSSTNSLEEEIKTNISSSTETFTFPSSLSDVADYSYDAHHDYSSEVSGSTTEALTTFVEEGSGEAENETLSYSTSSATPLILNEDDTISTTDRTLIIVENSTESWPSSTDITSSSEIPLNTYVSIEEHTTEITSSSTTEETSPSSSEIPTDVHFPTEESTSPSQSTSPTQSTTSEAPITPPIPTPVTQESTTEKAVTSSSSTWVVISTEAEELTTEKESEVILAGVGSSEPRGRLSVGRKEDGGVDPILLVVVSLALLVVLLAIVAAVLCRRKQRKVRLEPEAPPGTELQDMLLPSENGVRLLQQNGKEPEEKQRLNSDWEDKPIATVTARLTELAAPQTPVFIHKTLA